ncbi:MAG: hypothetical protein R3F49_10865 [Planctomycetota bacterium]
MTVIEATAQATKKALRRRTSSPLNDSSGSESLRMGVESRRHFTISELAPAVTAENEDAAATVHISTIPSNRRARAGKSSYSSTTSLHDSWPIHTHQLILRQRAGICPRAMLAD